MPLVLTYMPETYSKAWKTKAGVPETARPYQPPLSTLINMASLCNPAEKELKEVLGPHSQACYCNDPTSFLV